MLLLLRKYYATFSRCNGYILFSNVSRPLLGSLMGRMMPKIHHPVLQALLDDPLFRHNCLAIFTEIFVDFFFVRFQNFIYIYIFKKKSGCNKTFCFCILLVTNFVLLYLITVQYIFLLIVPFIILHFFAIKTQLFVEAGCLFVVLKKIMPIQSIGNGNYNRSLFTFLHY